MSVASFFLPTTCDIRRPFGSASPIASGIPCRLTSDFRNSRHAEDVPDWTHYLILDSSVDVRDGVTRLAGSNALTYVDGDEVRIPSGSTSPRYVVVWVEVANLGTPNEYKRVFLMRHSA
jgi:hypothetical protein